MTKKPKKHSAEETKNGFDNDSYDLSTVYAAFFDRMKKQINKRNARRIQSQRFGNAARIILENAVNKRPE